MIEFIVKRFDELSLLELYAILQLRNEVFILEQNCYYQDCDEKDIHAIHVMGLLNKQLVAYCRVLPEGVSYINYCSIGRVLTKSTVRKKGCGIELMNKAINVCKEMYTHPIKISAQLYLQNFYENLGFEVVSNEYLEDGIPHVAMVHTASKVLTP